MIHMVIRNRDPDCFKPINYATKSHVNLLNLNFRLAKVELIKSSEWETVVNINIISVLDWRWCKIVRFGRAVLCKIVRFDGTKMCKIVRFGRAVLCKIEGIHEFKSKHEPGGCLFF